MHIAAIRPGDTVIHDGVEKTVSGTDIKRDGFMGKTVFGDSYRLGRQLVRVVIYECPACEGAGTVWHPDDMKKIGDLYINHPGSWRKLVCQTCKGKGRAC